MNREVWYKIFRLYIDMDSSLNLLYHKKLIEDEEYYSTSVRLLNDIIETFKGEVEE